MWHAWIVINGASNLLKISFEKVSSMLNVFSVFENLSIKLTMFIFLKKSFNTKQIIEKTVRCDWSNDVELAGMCEFQCHYLQQCGRH